MRRLLLVLACAIVPACAQFTSLSTDYDGSRLFFVTTLRQAGTDQPAWGKVFMADGNGVHPVVIFDREVYASVFGGHPAHTTNAYDLTAINVGSDNTRLALTGRRECSGYTAGLCVTNDATAVYDARGEQSLATGGTVILSPNGTWGLAVTRYILGQTTFAIVNLASGDRYEAYSSIGNLDWRFHDVANDGTIVIFDYRRLGLIYPPDTYVKLADSSGYLNSPSIARLDAGGTTVVWEQLAENRITLMVARVSKTPLSVGSPVDLKLSLSSESPLAISDDGTRILFLSIPVGTDTPQISTIQSDGSNLRQLTRESDGIQDAVLSGNGRVAWALTGRGRVLRIQIESGQTSEIIGPVATFLRQDSLSYIPDLPRVFGAPGQSVTLPASVMPGETVEIDVGTLTVPILQVDKRSVTFQIPFGLTDPSPPVTIRKPGSFAWIASPIPSFITPQ